ncbi:MAG: CrcB family protein [Pseudomonadota bacterium]|nr:CrcB family protein [Pseudomonadota bacterium]
MIQTFAAIAAGGAMGAMLRHGANMAAVKLLGHGFPYGTLFVNITGSAAMGALVVVLAHYFSPPEFMRAFLITGLLGAFTTFSTFSLDFATLFERGNYVSAALYVGISVIISIIALFAAMAAARSFIS